MIDEVLAFWFEQPATDAETYGRKLRRWYMGGPAVDTEIRERFEPTVEAALGGKLDGWTQAVRGRLALIIVLDQFIRSVYRNDSRSYAGDEKAQALAIEALDRNLDRGLSIEHRHFLMMPLMHAEDLAMQERAVQVMDAIVADCPPWQQAMLSMGKEQTRKYRDIIARFGRFPHRNAILGRTSTPDEVEFLADWHEKGPPSGAKHLL
jgi:uncharacterized protein (DUF924 family)